MNSNTNLVEIFYLADEFCNEFYQVMEGHLLEQNNAKKRRKRKFKLNDAEVITIMIAFHLGGFRNLKFFYINYVQKHLTEYFPETVSYNRFVELQQKALLPLAMFLKLSRSGQSTGISFVDSTPIRVCRNKRIFNHKVFNGIAQRGKSTMGYFFGFKLHIIINDKGEIIEFVITPGNVDDREPLKDASFIKKIYGKLFADKGYVSKPLFEELFFNGIQLISGIRNNMKNQLMNMSDKIMLRKRSVIETVNDELKNICQVEHSRHRSIANFMSNMISGLIAYSFLPKKPSIKYERKESNGQLSLI